MSLTAPERFAVAISGSGGPHTLLYEVFPNQEEAQTEANYRNEDFADNLQDGDQFIVVRLSPV